MLLNARCLCKFCSFLPLGMGAIRGTCTAVNLLITCDPADARAKFGSIRGRNVAQEAGGLAWHGTPHATRNRTSGAFRTGVSSRSLTPLAAPAAGPGMRPVRGEGRVRVLGGSGLVRVRAGGFLILKKKKAGVSGGQQNLHSSNRWHLRGNRRRLECNRRRLESNRWRLESNRWQLEGNQWQLEGYRRRLETNCF